MLCDAVVRLGRDKVVGHPNLEYPVESNAFQRYKARAGASLLVEHFSKTKSCRNEVINTFYTIYPS